jgi:hypothetical protein
MVVKVERPHISGPDLAVEANPEQIRVLPAKNGRRLSRHPARGIDFELVEELEYDPGPDGGIGHDLDLGRGGKAEIAAAGLG